VEFIKEKNDTNAPKMGMACEKKTQCKLYLEELLRGRIA
jgi:hypothetical protein